VTLLGASVGYKVATLGGQVLPSFNFSLVIAPLVCEFSRMSAAAKAKITVHLLIGLTFDRVFCAWSAPRHPVVGVVVFHCGHPARRVGISRCFSSSSSGIGVTFSGLITAIRVNPLYRMCARQKCSIH